MAVVAATSSFDFTGTGRGASVKLVSESYRAQRRPSCRRLKTRSRAGDHRRSTGKGRPRPGKFTQAF